MQYPACSTPHAVPHMPYPTRSTPHAVPHQVVEHGDWQVADLLRRRVMAAAHEGTDAKVAHDDMAQFNVYYFVAPQHYLGSR